MKKQGYAGHYLIEKLPEFITNCGFICLKCGYRGLFITETFCTSCVKEYFYVESGIANVGYIWEEDQVALKYGIQPRLFEEENEIIEKSQRTTDFSFDVGIELLKAIDCEKFLNQSRVKSIIESVWYTWFKDCNDDDLINIKETYIKSTNKQIELLDYYSNEYKRVIKNKKYISKIIVNGLFGYHSYVLNFDKDDNFSIVIGTNGLGKTTILRIIEILLIDAGQVGNYNNYNYLLNLPFKQFELTFKDGTEIILYKGTDDLSICYRHPTGFVNTLGVYIEKNNKLDKLFDKLTNAYQAEFGVDKVEFMPLWVATNNEDRGKKYLSDFIEKSISKRDMEYYQDEMIKRLVQFDIHYRQIGKIFNKITQWNGQGRFHFVKTRRISVERIREDFLKKYEINDKESREELKKKFLLLQECFKSLYYSGDHSRKALINKNCRIKIKCEETGSIIELEQLSTGELNIISMLYEIIIYTEKDAIVFIDEPEISLHIAWQQRLGEMIQQIIKEKRGVQVIIATHSPFIAAGNTGLLVEAEPIKED